MYSLQHAPNKVRSPIRPSARNIVKIRVTLCILQEISCTFRKIPVFVGNFPAPLSDFPTYAGRFEKYHKGRFKIACTISDNQNISSSFKLFSPK